MSGGPAMTPAQRRAAVDRAEQSLALRSGAGCGKTFVLAQRFTELLLRADPGDGEALTGLVALTFTEKAALEMSQRVGKLLADRAAASTGEARRRLLGWIDQLPESRISTIHSFCASLLRAHAVEAGLDPSFAVNADEMLTAGLLADAADRAILSAVEDQRQDVAALLERTSYNRLVETVVRLVDRRTGHPLDDWADAETILARWDAQLGAERDAAWRELAGSSEVRDEVEQIAAIPCTDPGDRLAIYRKGQLAALRPILRDPAAAGVRAFGALNGKPGGVGSAKAWGKGVPKQVRDRIKALVARVAEFGVYAEELGDADRDAAEAIATLTQLAAEADLLYAAAKRQRGILDFTDLLDHAHRLLTGNPGLTRSLRGRIRQLLIDECQDTDAFQVSLLIETLLGPGAFDDAAEGARLFVVGDAKQSIYRFRGAQVEVFRDLCERLGPDRQEALDLSFRTHEAGVEFVNHLFAPLMGERYTPTGAHRKQTPPGPSVEVILAAGPDDGRMDAATSVRLQAAATAQRIREMLDDDERLVWDRPEEAWRPVRAGDVAILLARMTASGEYERELALRGIPFHVVSGTGFFKQQEVYDVLNALRVIDNPFDDVAMMGVLRSALVGLDDNALMHVAEGVAPPYLPGLGEVLLRDGGREREEEEREEREDPRIAIRGLSGEQNEALRVAVEMLLDLHGRKDAAGIDTLIGELLERTGYEATLLAQFHGRRMLGNVRRLVDLARTASVDDLSLADFVARMDELSVEQTRFEQAAVAGEAEDVVRLMTIHKAKGLEFPVVILPDLNAARRSPADMLIGRLDWGLTLNLPPAPGAGRDADDGPLSWRLARRGEDRDQRAEDIRKLYVAATRHEDHLVFVAADWRNSEGKLSRSGSYIELMDSQLGLADALDDERDTVPYADGRHAFVVGRVWPVEPRRDRKEPPPGERMMERADSGASLGEEILRAAPAGGPEMLGELPPEAGRVELAVTALADFQACPMLYRWRYELRVPAAPPADGTGGPKRDRAPATLDAATAGTFFHRCMELLDFTQPQEPAQLARQTAAEMQLDESVDVATLADELAGMLETFGRHELSAALRGAKAIYRELDFVLDVAPAVLRGQIDLLWQDAGGSLHVVDYKSDRVDTAGIPRRGEKYALQMLLYAEAAARHFGRAPLEATLYFLRPGATHVVPVTPAVLDGCRRGAEELVTALIRSRRGGTFQRRRSGGCEFCAYGALCG